MKGSLYHLFRETRIILGFVQSHCLDVVSLVSPWAINNPAQSSPIVITRAQAVIENTAPTETWTCSLAFLLILETDTFT